jgi:hypothetical protein
VRLPATAGKRKGWKFKRESIEQARLLATAGKRSTDARSASAGRRKKQKFKRENNAAFVNALRMNHSMIHNGQTAGPRSNGQV